MLPDDASDTGRNSVGIARQEPGPSDAPIGAAISPPILQRTGVGYDSHRFVDGGPLVLGGVSIPSPVRLTGHSDADAVCHAITDAVLGAACEGDIGSMFPDSAAENRNRSSIEMLALAVARVRENGYRVVNVDVTVVAEQPRIAPHAASMREVLSPALGVPATAISVKGKTNEGMGWIGRLEGLACIAVATLAGPA